MLKLDLQETESGAALVLAAVVAGQVAEDLGQRACIRGLGDTSLGVTLDDSAERFREVFAAHLATQLGQGFVIESEAGEALVTIRLDLAEGEEEADDGAVAAAAPKKRRGRPPGSKNKATPAEVSE